MNDRFFKHTSSIKETLDFAMIITCLFILAYSIWGKDTKPLGKKLKKIDWGFIRNQSWDNIKGYAKQGGRMACEPLLKLWFVLNDYRTSTLEKVLIYAAIIYTLSQKSIIPASRFRLLGTLDEGVAIGLVIKKVHDKTTPAIEIQVKEVLDDWFGPLYTVNNARV